MTTYHLAIAEPDDEVNHEPELDIPAFEEAYLDLGQVIELADYDYDNSDEFFNY